MSARRRGPSSAIASAAWNRSTESPSRAHSARARPNHPPAVARVVVAEDLGGQRAAPVGPLVDPGLLDLPRPERLGRRTLVLEVVIDGLAQPARAGRGIVVGSALEPLRRAPMHLVRVRQQL